jgi:hypothetical protein
MFGIDTIIMEPPDGIPVDEMMRLVDRGRFLPVTADNQRKENHRKDGSRKCCTPPGPIHGGGF